MIGYVFNIFNNQFQRVKHANEENFVRESVISYVIIMLSINHLHYIE